MKKSIEISNHALVRWMERTGLTNFAPIREALAESLANAAEAAVKLGASEFLILADGLVFVVRDGIVHTVVPEDGRHQHVRMLARKPRADDHA